MPRGDGETRQQYIDKMQKLYPPDAEKEVAPVDKFSDTEPDTPDPGLATDLGQLAVQGALLGQADTVIGGMAGLQEAAGFGDQDPKKEYLERIKDAFRKRQMGVERYYDQANERSPILGGITEGVAGIVPSLVAAPLAAAKYGSAATKILGNPSSWKRLMGLGTIEGGIQGHGYSSGEADAGETALDTLQGMGIGTIAGAGQKSLEEVVEFSKPWIKSQLAKYFGGVDDDLAKEIAANVKNVKKPASEVELEGEFLGATTKLRSEVRSSSSKIRSELSDEPEIPIAGPLGDIRKEAYDRELIEDIKVKVKDEKTGKTELKDKRKNTTDPDLKAELNAYLTATKRIKKAAVKDDEGVLSISPKDLEKQAAKQSEKASFDKKNPQSDPSVSVLRKTMAGDMKKHVGDVDEAYKEGMKKLAPKADVLTDTENLFPMKQKKGKYVSRDALVPTIKKTVTDAAKTERRPILEKIQELTGSDIWKKAGGAVTAAKLEKALKSRKKTGVGGVAKSGAGGFVTGLALSALTKDPMVMAIVTGIGTVGGSGVATVGRVLQDAYGPKIAKWAMDLAEENPESFRKFVQSIISQASRGTARSGGVIASDRYGNQSRAVP